MNGNFSNEPIQKYCCVANDFGFDWVTQRKPKETLSGVLKVGIGFMIFNIGGGHVGTIAANFATLFQTAFGVQGTVLAVEPATALAMDVYGFEISMIMGLGSYSD